jgi:hypothetical protein
MRALLAVAFFAVASLAQAHAQEKIKKPPEEYAAI